MMVASIWIMQYIFNVKHSRAKQFSREKNIVSPVQSPAIRICTEKKSSSGA